MSEEKEAEEREIPEKWEEMDIEGMGVRGWRPRIKKKGRQSYLTMRFGDQERSLGPATPELVDLFCNTFPDLGSKLISTGDARSPKKTKVYLQTPIKRPSEIGSGYRPSLEVLNWFRWAKGKNFDGTLGDFVNDVVSTYFRSQGWKLAVVKAGS